jgi:hypothetical protein
MFSHDRKKALTAELSELSDLHRKVTQDARYIGLSSKESAAYDQRRIRMREILTVLGSDEPDPLAPEQKST